MNSATLFFLFFILRQAGARQDRRGGRVAPRSGCAAARHGSVGHATQHNARTHARAHRPPPPRCRKHGLVDAAPPRTHVHARTMHAHVGGGRHVARRGPSAAAAVGGVAIDGPTWVVTKACPPATATAAAAAAAPPLCRPRCSTAHSHLPLRHWIVHGALDESILEGSHRC